MFMNHRISFSLWSLFAATVMLVSMSACRKHKEAAAAESVSAPSEAVVAEPNVSTPNAGPEVFATYERTPCFGMCPIFKLTIYTDGSAEYVGKNFVNLIGEYQTSVSKAQMARIVLVADGIKYFSMKDEYNNEKVTDLPSVITEIRGIHGLKRVRNRQGGPSELKQLYSVFDEIVRDGFWVAKQKN